MLSMVVCCSWIGPDRKWNNPYDSEGTATSCVPEITGFPGDTTIAVHDKLPMAVEGACEGGRIVGYQWSFDEGATFESTDTGLLERAWKIADTGVRPVLVRTVNELGLVSAVSRFEVTVLGCPPVLVPIDDDAVAGRSEVVERILRAQDSNGRIAMFLWGTVGEEWSDSACADTSGMVPARFSNPKGGMLHVRWAARDDDGLVAIDSFKLLFNRYPDSVRLVAPRSGEDASLDTYDFAKNTGTLRCSFSAHDPDSSDTITFSLLITKTGKDTVFFHMGKDSSVIVGDIEASTTYEWKLTAQDISGARIESSGEFTTETAPKGPEGMVLLRSASAFFQMGQSGFDSSESPLHVTGFTRDLWLDTTEVTAGNYAHVMAGTLIEGEEAILPVRNVSWFDAVLYCNARSVLDGRDTVYAYHSRTVNPDGKTVLDGLVADMRAEGYRLPTEAEWEYACRRDSLTLFFWGNDPAAAEEYSWTRENSGGRVHPVARKKPNVSGLYDMAGNVWEWVNDWFDPEYYLRAPAVDPYGPVEGETKVIRGGSWNNSLYFSQAGTRSTMPPEAGAASIGFRTVLVIK